MQILQRQITRSKTVPIERATSANRPRPNEEELVDGYRAETNGSTGTGGKRKYRRHPKVRFTALADQGDRSRRPRPHSKSIREGLVDV